MLAPRLHRERQLDAALPGPEHRNTLITSFPPVAVRDNGTPTGRNSRADPADRAARRRHRWQSSRNRERSSASVRERHFESLASCCRRRRHDPGPGTSTPILSATRPRPSAFNSAGADPVAREIPVQGVASGLSRLPVIAQEHPATAATEHQRGAQARLGRRRRRSRRTRRATSARQSPAVTDGLIGSAVARRACPDTIESRAGQ